MSWQMPLAAKFQAAPEASSGDPGPLVVIAVITAFGVFELVRRLRRSRWRARPRGRRRRRAGSGGVSALDGARETGNNVANPLYQMEAIEAVKFEVQPLLNRREARILPVLEETVAEIGKGHRVMAQTSMGEILRPKRGFSSARKRKDAFASINSKRFDFAVFDRNHRLVCAIEYQGDGHHQGKAFMRDAVKREVVRKAGVSWIEINPGDKPSQLRANLRRALGAPPDPIGPGGDGAGSAF